MIKWILFMPFIWLSKYFNKEYRKDDLYMDKTKSTEDILRFKDFEFRQYSIFCA